MIKINFQTTHTLALAFVGVLATGSIFADPPSWSEGGKDRKHEQNDRRENRQGDKRDRNESSSHDREQSRMESGRYFGERHRTIIHDYYAGQYHAGRCPPGLAKKHNGCMPPGQARKWTVGRPLPRDMIYYDLPPAIVVQLGPPPTGHRYVRVASDILLIAVGTGMVVDAFQDIYGN